MLIQINDLQKKYGQTFVLADVSLQINSGEFIGIVGESGSGKSTLLYTLSGLKTIDHGSILIDSKNIAKLKQNELVIFRRKNFGFIFQENYLINYLTVKENILLPVQQSTKEVEKRVDDLLEFIKVASLAHKFPYSLSVGQKQRIAVARALVNQPLILFADEPTASLDAENARNILSLLSQYRESFGLTIIMVSHNQGEWECFDRIFKIENKTIRGIKGSGS